MEPKVSVIVPNYNHALYLKQRLDSILHQTYRDFELIILDDRSQDNSLKIIEPYRYNHKVSHIEYNIENSGSTFAQWEKGLQLAKGKWVWIAESDDYAEPDFLETLVNLAESKENIGIAFANSHWVDQNGIEKESLSLYNESFYRDGLDEVKGMIYNCTIQNVSSTLIRRDMALNAITGLKQYRACGDWIFYTRILHHSNIIYTAQKLNYFRWYHANVSNTNKNRLWALEGIHVLDNIDFKRVRFTVGNCVNIAKHWSKKALSLNFKDSIETWSHLLNASARYLLS